MMTDRVKHVLEPFIFAEAKVLILGTMPSPRSRELGFYYGHPQNRFWKALSAVFGEEKPCSVEEMKAFLFNRKIALWDVLAECDINGADDASIKNAVVNDINGAVKGTKIKEVFTTGKKARDLLYKLAGMESVCLPSPSPANCAVSLERLVVEYKKIKEAVEDE